MSTIVPTLPPTTVDLPQHPDIIVQNKFAIPGWVTDLASFRQWAHSDAYPQTGWVSFLDGRIFVDPDMETFLTHNQVKQAFNLGIGMVLLAQPTGRFVPDRMLYTNPAANVSTEPDGLYAHWETWRSARLRLVPGKEIDYTELEGTADMVLEIVSKSSEKKDTVTLRELYARAGVLEYWLVDVRKEAISFQILRLVGQVYEPALSEEGWVRSEIFSRSFQLVRETDPLGQARFVLNVPS